MKSPSFLKPKDASLFSLYPELVVSRSCQHTFFL